MLLDGPPPGDGLNTLTSFVPAVATALAGTGTVSNVLLTKVVGEAVVPFHCTWDPEMKLDPTTLKVKAAPPRSLLLGETAAMLGTGFAGGGGGGGGPLPPHPGRSVKQQANANN